jgi:hypothetical protein
MTGRHNDIHAELAALADGSLPAQRREQVLASVRASPELSDNLDAQRRAIAGIGSQATVEAPVRLHRSIQALVDGAAMPVRRRARARLRLASVVALSATAATAAVLALTANTPPVKAPTVLQAAQLALRPATLPAPAESPRDRGLLASSVDGISYPYWGGRLGWRAAGSRTDRLAGHAVTTVFYADGSSRRIGYAIVAGSPLPAPTDAAVVEQAGVRFRVLDASGATVVTWRQAGHTCILAAHGVSSAILLGLASWHRS